MRLEAAETVTRKDRFYVLPSTDLVLNYVQNHLQVSPTALSDSVSRFRTVCVLD